MFATPQMNTDPGHGAHWVDIAELHGVYYRSMVRCEACSSHAVKL